MAKIPKFKSDQEAAEFWDIHSLTDFEDELELVDEKVFVKPEKQIVSIRMERKQVELLKKIAAKMGIGYSPLIRLWILERLNKVARKA